MFLSGGTPMGRSLREKINDYWEHLGKKYGFNFNTVEASPSGKLFFYADAYDVPEIKKETESESFENASRPLIKWLSENAHPHMKVIVTSTRAELLEGQKTTGEITEYLRD